MKDLTIDLSPIKTGLGLILLLLLFGIGMGIAFGVFEDTFKDYIAQGIAANPDLHDEKSQSKIWRYAQRAHFHATGIGAFSLVLIVYVLLSGMKATMKKVTSVLIGLTGLYPLAWFNMFYLAPSMGRSAAHEHILTELLTYIGTGGLLLGLFILLSNLFLGLFNEQKPYSEEAMSSFLK